MKSKHPREVLTIHGFRSIKEAEIEMGLFTVLIGEQAQGKSLVAKLRLFFYTLIGQLSPGWVSFKRNSYSVSEITSSAQERFLRYFPAYAFPDAFKVSLRVGDYKFSVAGDNGNIVITLDKVFIELAHAVKRVIEEKAKTIDLSSADAERAARMEVSRECLGIIPDSLRKGAIFIPANRVFFSAFDNAESKASAFRNVSDPALVDFIHTLGFAKTFYKNLATASNNKKSSDRATDELVQKMESILKAKYTQEDEDDYLLDEHGKVRIAHSSSGQQVAFPMLCTVAVYSRFLANPTHCFFIEEPEAHLYPSAQKEVIEFLSLAQANGQAQFFVTTHSPYILASINNLMLANMAGTLGNTQAMEVASIVNKGSWLDKTTVRAYKVCNGSVTSIISSDTGLIQAEEIDTVSSDISIEYDKLLNIMYS